MNTTQQKSPLSAPTPADHRKNTFTDSIAHQIGSENISIIMEPTPCHIPVIIDAFVGSMPAFRLYLKVQRKLLEKERMNFEVTQYERFRSGL